MAASAAATPRATGRLVGRQGRREKPPALGRLGDWITFGISPLSLYAVSVNGQLPYGEIIVLLLLPYLLFTQRDKIFREEYRTAYLLLGLWIFSQFVTDVYVGTPFASQIKGFARVAFFGLDLAFLSALIHRDRRRMVLFFSGCTASALLYSVVGGMDFDTLWKMALSKNITAGLLVAIPFALRRAKYWPYALVVLGVAALDLHFGDRSSLMFDLATALLLLPVLRDAAGVKSAPSARAAKVFAILILGLSAVWASQKAIGWAVSAGLYKDALSYKFEGQSAGKFGILFGGRPEAPVAIRAILDSPFLGHGSYAVDPKYMVLLQDYQYELGYSDSDAPDEEAGDYIPTHSHLTLAWVEGGFLASFFWFYMLALCARSIFALSSGTHRFRAVFLYSFIVLFWDILFSPYGYTRRLTESFLLILMVNLFGSPETAYSAPPAQKALPRPLRRRSLPPGPARPQSGWLDARPLYPRTWRNSRPRPGRPS